ncbi:glycosyltransferase family 4 protein [Alcaligenaceae bacterium]|nr:glycosyltransferase family 4 protein [Alcaligenaceae bacterium]
MKILQLNFERGWRGGERQTLLCMRQFRDAGHDVQLLARKGGELAQRACQEGFIVHQHANLFGVPAYLARKGRGFDILHAQTANMLTWLAVLKPWLGDRIVFTRRTAFPVSARREPRTLWKWRRADALVAISRAAAAEPARLGLEATIIPSAVVSKPVDTAHVHAFTQEFNLAGKHVLGTVAAMTSEKDPCTLVRAVHALRRRRDDFVFVHLGAGGDAQAATHALVKELGLENHFLFAGFRSAIDDLYRLMDVFVISSRHEALGTSVLDAFQYSVPVVATDAGGLAEILADGRGLLCPVGDHTAMADAIDLVLSDRGLRAAMIEKARAYVQQEHDAGTMGLRYLAVYEQLVESDPVRGLTP